jgi:DNA-binding transcriptional LysR family regulator
MLNFIHDSGTETGNVPLIDPGIVDSKRLQMFFASVKLGSFAAAANALSVSPSAISHAMKGLEEDLGCSLFRRLGPQVKPTGAAVRLLPMVEELLMRMSSMKSEMAALHGRAEKLVIRMPNSLSGLLQTGMLATFSDCFPSANLEILLGGGADAPMTDPPVDFEIDHMRQFPGDKVRRDLMQEEFKPYVAPFHVFGQQSKVTTGELLQSLLMIPGRDVLELLIRQLGARGVNPDLKVWILPTPTAARDLAQHGQGITFLPRWAAAAAEREGTLVPLKVPGVEIQRTCCAWWEPHRPLTWVAEVFLSLLAAEIDTNPPSL